MVEPGPLIHSSVRVLLKFCAFLLSQIAIGMQQEQFETLLPTMAIETILRILRYVAVSEKDRELHPIWAVGVPLVNKYWHDAWLRVRKSPIRSDAALYRQLSANGKHCPLLRFDHRPIAVSRKWRFMSYRILFSAQGPYPHHALRSTIPWPGQTNSL